MEILLPIQMNLHMSTWPHMHDPPPEKVSMSFVWRNLKGVKVTHALPYMFFLLQCFEKHPS